jgi:hypothetical protein
LKYQQIKKNLRKILGRIDKKKKKTTHKYRGMSEAGVSVA